MENYNMKKLLQKWLLKDLVEENAAQWQAVWDLRAMLLTCREHGLYVKIKEIDIPDRNFFNSLEKKRVGSRLFAGYINKNDEAMVTNQAMRFSKKTKEEVVKIWEDVDLDDEKRLLEQGSTPDSKQ